MADISYLKKMRCGQPPHNVATLGNGSGAFDVAVVLLSNDTMLSINEEVESRYHPVTENGVEVKNPMDNPKNRALYYNRLLCYHCMQHTN